MIAGTFPSGTQSVVDLRTELCACMFGLGPVAEFVELNDFTCPTVNHIMLIEYLDSDTVFVGVGASAFDITPWTCPFIGTTSSSICNRDSIANYFEVRMDKIPWLAWLSGKHLICNCTREPEDCWAYALQKYFM